jgi:lysozyme family protein
LIFTGIDQSSHEDFPFSNPKPSDVVAAYRKDWNRVAGPQLPGPVAAVVANFAVNMGHSPAVKLLQEAIGVKVDLGPRTVSSAQLYPKSFVLAHEVISLADARYERLADNNARLRQFLHEWLNRDKDLHREETQA